MTTHTRTLQDIVEVVQNVLKSVQIMQYQLNEC